MNSNPPAKRILLLSANPRSTSRLRLDEEIREIKEGLRRAKQRENFVIESAEAVRYWDIRRRAILDFEPNIVHFSGHGEGEEGLVFEDEMGQKKLVDAEALAGLFELFVSQVECVVLNACYSNVQAEAIAQHIPYVIGMKKAIADKAAIAFAVGFYDALGAGKLVEDAYKFGCNAIQFEMSGSSAKLSINTEDKKAIPGDIVEKTIIPEHLKPILLKRENPVISQPKNDSKDIPIDPDLQVYIEREIDYICQREIAKNGALIRIRASKKMGKTLLINQLLSIGEENHDYHTAYLDLQEPEANTIKDLSNLLQYFCREVCAELDFPDRVENHWQENNSLPENMKCRSFFENNILCKIDTGLVLGIDNIDRLFVEPFQTVAADFFSMLRAWHNRRTRKKAWKKFKLIIAYSTEKFPSLGAYESPFNVGCCPAMTGFNDEQIFRLAKSYQYDLSTEEAYTLMTQLKGHPFLIHQMLEVLSRNSNHKLDDLLNQGSTDAGIYYNHFKSYWNYLQKSPELAYYLQEIILSSTPILIPPDILYELDALGLIDKVGDKVQLKCELYRTYFSHHRPILEDIAQKGESYGHNE